MALIRSAHIGRYDAHEKIRFRKYACFRFRNRFRNRFQNRFRIFNEIG